MSWFFLIVAAPVLAPAFCLAITILPFRERLPIAAQRVVRVVSRYKDGQLGWLGGMLCAEAIWEMRSATSRGHGLGEHFDVAGLFYFVVLIVFNSSFVVGGALFPTGLPRPLGRSFHEHYALLCSSVGAFAASCCGAVLVHIELNFYAAH
jgi:hypothetical protein